MAQFIFESSTSNPYTRIDHENADGAIAAVEAVGSGQIIKFKRQRNIPGCLPEYELKSLALWGYADGKWTQYSLFSSTCEAIGDERPS